MDVKLSDTLEGGEIEVINMEVTVDNGLDTSVYISLFTHNNWWAGFYGSDLYKIKKNSQENRLIAKQYIQQSLQWMIDEGVAESVTVELSSILQNGFTYDIIIQEPEQTTTYKYSENWNEQKKIIERLN